MQELEQRFIGSEEENGAYDNLEVTVEALKRASRYISIKQLAEDSGMNVNTFWSRLRNDGPEFSSSERAAISAALHRQGLALVMTPEARRRIAAYLQLLKDRVYEREAAD